MTAIAYTVTCNYTAHSQLAGRKMTKATVCPGEAEKEAAHVYVCVCVCVCVCVRACVRACVCVCDLCVVDRCIAQVWPAQVRGSGSGKRCVIRTLYRGERYFGIISYFQYLHNTKWLTMSNVTSRDTEKIDSAQQRILLRVSVCVRC